MSIRKNIQVIKERIHLAAERANRSPDSVKLIAITKTVGISEIRELVAAGQTIFGENRPQALRDKISQLVGPKVAWHLVGTLQANKIKYVYPVVEMIQSVDRCDLLEEFGKWTGKTGRVCSCLLEVHISPEDTKFGFAPEEVLEVIKRYRNREDLNICGLMGIAPFVPDPAPVRASFKLLADLFRKSQDLEGPGYHARELSMGMTDDFEIAIEEGATMVRIGRALFMESPEP